MSAGGIQKTLTKLRQSIAEGNFYEAHQMYRTIANRYSKHKKFDDAKELLRNGVLELAKSKQFGSALDLGVLEVYDESETPVTEFSAGIFAMSRAGCDEFTFSGQLVELFVALINESNNHQEAIEFMSGVIRWSAKFGVSNTGEPALHHLLGELLKKNKDFEAAERHFLLGLPEQSPQSMVQMIPAWIAEEESGTESAYLARFVLKYLCLKRYEHARACFTLYAVNKTARSVKVSDGSFVSVYDDAFLNFCQLLLLAIQHGKPGLFLQLKSRYLASLCEYYEDAKKLFSDIGELYFGIRNQQSGQVNLNQLLGALFSGNGV